MVRCCCNRVGDRLGARTWQRDGAFDQGAHRIEQVIKIADDAEPWLCARKAKQLLSEIDSAVGNGNQAVDPFLCRVVVAQLCFQQFKVAQDDAAGELADGFHFLPATQRFF